MGTDLDDLKIVLAVRDREFAKAMDRNSKVVRKFANKSGKDLSKTTKSFNKMSIAARGLVPALSATALIAATRRVVSSLDNIGKTADKLGLTTDALQELRAAAESAGVASNTLDMAMQRFGRRVAEARQGTGEARAALEEMGIALFDAEGNARNIDDVLGSVADSFANVADQTDMNRLAMKLFDSEGVAMVNMLRDGSAALDRTREEMRKMGVVIDESLIRKAEDAQSQIDALSRVIGANLSTALIELAPLLIETANLLVYLSKVAAQGFEDISRMGGNLAVIGAAGDIEKITGQIESMEAALSNMPEGQIGLARTSLEDSLAAARTELATKYGVIDRSIGRSGDMPDAPTEFGSTVEDFNDPVSGIRDEMAATYELIEAMRVSGQAAGMNADELHKMNTETQAAEIMTRLLAAAVEDGSEVTDLERETINGVAQAYRDQAEALYAAETAQTASSGARSAAIDLINAEADALSELDAANLRVIEGFVDIVAGAKSFEDALNGVLRKAFELSATSFLQGLFGVGGGGGGGLGGFFNSAGASLMGRASGGSVQAGSSYMVGEHGPEPFVPAQNGRILSTAQAKDAVGGGGGGGNVTINMSFTTDVKSGVRAEIMGLLPQIESVAKSAVLDANQRGGSFRRSIVGG